MQPLPACQADELVRLLERSSAAPSQAGAAPDQREAVQSRPGRTFVCVACGNPITDTRERIEVGGAHAHTFANPHGFVFRIGCFRGAFGCVRASGESTDYPWFAGYAWHIVVCARCHTHVGWGFRSSEDSFFGLILDRIVENEEGGKEA